MINYHVTKGLSTQDVIAKGKIITACATEDIEFLPGIKAEFVSGLVSKIQLLQEMPTYSIQRFEKKQVTALRDEKAKELRFAIEDFKAQLSPVFKGANYLPEFTGTLSKESVASLLTRAGVISGAIKANATKSALYGVTTDEIEAFDQLIGEVYSLLDEKEMEEANLGMKTSVRLALKAEITEQLDYLALRGRAYWKRRNPLRYRLYQLQKSTNASPEASSLESAESTTDGSSSAS